MTESGHASELTGAPVRAGRLRLVLILGAVGAFGPLSIDAYLPGLPQLSKDLEASASAAQATLTGCLVGLAVGQLLAGPLSDALGRRRPLLVGLAGYAVTSLLCALAPSIWMLNAMRLLQGMAGAAGIVIARAIVRDLHTGAAAARYFSQLMLVTGVAPILAPILGAQILYFTSWRGIFVGLTAVGAALFLSALLGLPETHRPERRRAGGLTDTLSTYRRLLSDRVFLGYTLSCGLTFAAMFAYIAGSPFVLQDIYGVSPQVYSVIFGLNALGLIGATQVSAHLVTRVGPRRLMAAGLTTGVAGAGALLAAILADWGLGAILPCLVLVVASIGLILPNGTALALGDHPEAAGSASALVGLFQFVIGAGVAPVVGAAGRDTAVPMALAIAAMEIAAMLVYVLLTGRRSSGQTRRPEG